MKMKAKEMTFLDFFVPCHLPVCRDPPARARLTRPRSDKALPKKNQGKDDDDGDDDGSCSCPDPISNSRHHPMSSKEEQFAGGDAIRTGSGTGRGFLSLSAEDISRASASAAAGRSAIDSGSSSPSRRTRKSVTVRVPATTANMGPGYEWVLG